MDRAILASVAELAYKQGMKPRSLTAEAHMATWVVRAWFGALVAARVVLVNAIPKQDLRPTVPAREQVSLTAEGGS